MYSDSDRSSSDARRSSCSSSASSTRSGGSCRMRFSAIAYLCFRAARRRFSLRRRLRARQVVERGQVICGNRVAIEHENFRSPIGDLGSSAAMMAASSGICFIVPSRREFVRKKPAGQVSEASGLKPSPGLCARQAPIAGARWLGDTVSCGLALGIAQLRHGRHQQGVARAIDQIDRPQRWAGVINAASELDDGRVGAARNPSNFTELAVKFGKFQLQFGFGWDHGPEV